ncbi:hypothetical protein [Trabulsiella odontotermitis]|uniref:hypothetical protein n=1 Tax=Trabulsiella odontotermitis TaxID=379893 RepID=UPI000675EB87|nr:hypothetical protein [Trabulsiella odontotermitis]
MINLSEEDTHTISNYIRLTHRGYNGPVFVDIRRLAEIHMSANRKIVSAALDKARHKSKGAA